MRPCLARKPPPTARPDIAAPADAAPPRSCSPRSARSSAAATRRCATCCSTPTTRSANSTRSRTRSPNWWPVSKALREIRNREKPTRSICRRTLSNTRTAYGKLRNEVTELEKRASRLKRETEQLRKDPRSTECGDRRWKPSAAELAIDIADGARRSPTRGPAESGSASRTKSLRDENGGGRRHKAASTSTSMAGRRSEVNTLAAEAWSSPPTTKSAPCRPRTREILPATSGLARKLAEGEKHHGASTRGLRSTENSLRRNDQRARPPFCRARGANDVTASESPSQQDGFDALQARANATDTVLMSEARDHVGARSEESARVGAGASAKPTQSATPWRPASPGLGGRPVPARGRRCVEGGDEPQLPGSSAPACPGQEPTTPRNARASTARPGDGQRR